MSTPKKNTTTRKSTPQLTQAEITAASRGAEQRDLEAAIAHQKTVADLTAQLNAIEAAQQCLHYAAAIIDRQGPHIHASLAEMYPGLDD